MVGEIRDAETAKIATQAALTGHLVLSTLHTNDAPAAITRLFNLGIEPYLVGATVAGVLAQRLVRKLCQACAGYEPSINGLENRAGRLGGESIEKALPKPRIFTGRIGIYELLVPDDNMIERISARAGLNEIKELATRIGMKPCAWMGSKRSRPA